MRAKESILDLGFGILAHIAQKFKELKEQGKELRTKLTEKLKESKTQGREIREKIEQELADKKQKLFNFLGLVSKRDIEELKAKLAEIERKLSGE
jgi:polyhydroxyalkanoate synthesis regulator phasin